jgi:hypothetical protein
MPVRRVSKWWVFAFAAVLLAPAGATGQTVNGAVVGVVQDSSGGVVPDVALTIRNIARDEIVGTIVSEADGSYAFRNLAPGKYEVQATKDGFNPVSFPDVEVTLGQQVRLDVALAAGGVSERVEVLGGTSVLGTTPTQEHGISPETLNQLPLLFGTGPRAAATFALLMPGVSTGAGNNAFDARINGGLQSGDEASVDGVSMQQGFMSQGGMVSILQDFPMSPDMVSEIKVLTSGYAPEYGSSTGGQIMAVTKSGSNQFHGSAFEFHQDASLTGIQWGGQKNPYNKNNFGANIGGPIPVPGMGDKWKNFFYFDHERYRQVGGATADVLSIPSMLERQGDFRDWRDASGNLIPIYDPATLRSDGHGGFIKDQFMGCDGKTPNVICANRINPIVQPWLAALPNPTSAGPLNNFQAPPIPDTILGDSDYYMWRIDSQIGNNDHVFASFWHQRAPAKFYSQLPQAIATETYSDPQNSWVNRMNYDKVFTSTFLNHMSMGYLNRNEGYGCVNQDFADEFPQIGGVAGHNVPPTINLDQFNAMGCNAGVNLGNVTTRPTFIINDAVTWTKSAHTIKIGMEWRKIMGNIHANGNEAGTFDFGGGATGLVGVNSGNAVASFLLGAADGANVSYRSVPSWYARQHAWILHAGDSWRLNNKLTLDYGLRWDYYSPSSEKYDQMSFFDPTGANPGAAGRPGRLAFAGDAYGAASYGKPYPEENWYGGLAPRVGGVYALNEKTVIRGGWGIFYTQAFYPGWGGGMSLDGFSNDPSVSSSLGGIKPAMYLDQGFPIGQFPLPPDIRSDYKNGQSIYYRNIDGNKRPYTHQWNLTVDRELGHQFALSAAYVGSAGRRLPSSIDPINAIDPSYLALGDRLNDEFEPGMTSLNGVPLPYAGWVEQMTSCAPSVAQALRPYPQYCDALQGQNEAHGKSLYNSMQLKLEKRFSKGTYALVSYTLSHLMESGSSNTQRDANTWSGITGVISPFEKDRNYVISQSDTPHVLSAAFVYELPFGHGKAYGADSSGVVNALISGWQVSTIYKYQSAPPMYFRVGGNACNVPGQFRSGCIPGIINPGAVFAQDKGSFDPGKGPLFNKDAFEPVGAFNYYAGSGNRVEESIRGFSYRNQDLTFMKNTRLGGGTNLQLRLEMFNMWNWHSFQSNGEWGNQAFVNNLADPDFGKWDGSSVTAPRQIQLGIRFEF